MHIAFNQPFITGKETEYIIQAVENGKISGNGEFTKKCHQFFEKRYDFHKCLLTTSCTDALEMAALLVDIKPGDEVIMPSYTFVSTANAFVLRGAVIRFADSYPDHPNIDPSSIEGLITSKTKAIVVVHYGGIACDMDKIIHIANENGLVLIEDAAQAIDSYYINRPLGSIGDLATFSFHETKNIQCGEGGMIVVSDEKLIKRAEIIWEKGTNRSAFFRGEVDKYNWIDVGSSFLPSELASAFLFAQLQKIDDIQKRRKSIWNWYFESLLPLAIAGKFKLLEVPNYATNNAHLFTIICNSLTHRNNLLKYLNSIGINAVFHYLPLHISPYYCDKAVEKKLPNAERFGNCLIRLPLHINLEQHQISKIVDSIREFYL